MRVEQPPAIISWPRARRLLVGLLRKRCAVCVAKRVEGGRLPRTRPWLIFRPGLQEEGKGTHSSQVPTMCIC